MELGSMETVTWSSMELWIWSKLHGILWNLRFSCLSSMNHRCCSNVVPKILWNSGERSIERFDQNKFQWALKRDFELYIFIVMSNSGNTCGIMQILMIKHKLVKETYKRYRVQLNLCKTLWRGLNSLMCCAPVVVPLAVVWIFPAQSYKHYKNQYIIYDNK